MTIRDILDIIKSTPDESAYGLRRVDPSFMPAVGHEVPFSWDWDRENDCPSDDLLCGSSCIGVDIADMMIYFDNMDEKEELAVIKRIASALEQITENNYSGDLILVAGTFKGDGDDTGEVLIDGIRLL